MTHGVAGSKRPVGIIGAGQLAMMLADAARQLGLSSHVLAASVAEPAARSDDVSVTLGSRADRAALRRFLGPLQIVAIDQELNETGPLRAALADVAASGSVPDVVPPLAALVTCSDKSLQKQRLSEAGLPTPAWMGWEPRQESASAWLERAAQRFSGGAVLKLGRGGYDGRGTLVVKDWTVARAAATAFCQHAVTTDSPLYAESFVPFVAELAVVSTRWRDGRVVQYPTAWTRQQNSVCVEVRGPAAMVGVDADAAASAQALAARAGEVFGLVGTYAVEMFLLKDGRIEINEIAPRVHNSGHFTLTAAKTSQFENHWRAALDLEPGSVDTAPFWGMINVLGRVSADLGPGDEFSLASEGLASVWYRKEQSRPGRKLGHVSVSASSLTELDRRMAAVDREIDRWHAHLAERTQP